MPKYKIDNRASSDEIGSQHVGVKEVGLNRWAKLLEQCVKGISAFLNAAGVTGKPIVDWCEGNKIETLSSNVDTS